MDNDGLKVFAGLVIFLGAVMGPLMFMELKKLETERTIQLDRNEKLYAVGMAWAE